MVELDYFHLSSPNPEWVRIAESFPIPQVVSIQEFVRTETELRKKYHEANKPKPNPNISVDEMLLSVDGGEIPLRTYVPKKEVGDPPDGLPLLLWMFGGGFVIGSLDDDDGLLRDVAQTHRIICVSADYRKAPSHPFPAAINDSYECLKWAVDNAPKLTANIREGLIIGGISSGANIAAVLTQRASVDVMLKGKVTGQLLLVPNTVAPDAYPEKFKSDLTSLNEEADKRILPKKLYIEFQKAYHGGWPSDHPEISPALFDSLETLPPTYIQICGLDILRDEGLLYERLLRNAQVPTKLDIYAGLPHGFWLFCKDFEATKKQRQDFREGLTWLLKRGAVDDGLHGA